VKKVEIKKGTRVCSKKLGGCGRTIEQGEWVWMKKGHRNCRRRFLCEECYDKVAH